MYPLQKERLLRQLNKSRMAELCGIDRAHYGRLEEGAHKPSPELADRIAKRLGNAVTRDQLLFPDDYVEKAS